MLEASVINEAKNDEEFEENIIKSLENIKTFYRQDYFIVYVCIKSTGQWLTWSINFNHKGATQL